MSISFLLRANHCITGATVALDDRNLPADQILSGQPRIGNTELGRLGEHSIGVWELTPGVSTDIEIDEFFIVLSGAAVVDFQDGSPSLRLKPGTIGRLAAGTATTWTVTETLRKVYIA